MPRWSIESDTASWYWDWKWTLILFVSQNSLKYLSVDHRGCHQRSIGSLWFQTPWCSGRTIQRELFAIIYTGREYLLLESWIPPILLLTKIMINRIFLMNLVKYDFSNKSISMSWIYLCSILTKYLYSPSELDRIQTMSVKCSRQKDRITTPNSCRS